MVSSEWKTVMSSELYSRSFISVLMSSFVGCYLFYFFYIRATGEACVGPVTVYRCSFLLLLPARLKGGGEMKYSERAVSAQCASISGGEGGRGLCREMASGTS